MKLMYKFEGGYHNFADSEVEAAMKDGWVDGDPIREAASRSKMNPVETLTETATIDAPAAPRRMGRPKKAESV